MKKETAKETQRKKGKDQVVAWLVQNKATQQPPWNLMDRCQQTNEQWIKNKNTNTCCCPSCSKICSLPSTTEIKMVLNWLAQDSQIKEAFKTNHTFVLTWQHNTNLWSVKQNVHFWVPLLCLHVPITHLKWLRAYAFYSIKLKPYKFFIWSQKKSNHFSPCVVYTWTLLFL